MSIKNEQNALKSTDALLFWHFHVNISTGNPAMGETAGLPVRTWNKQVKIHNKYISVELSAFCSFFVYIIAPT